ncbi:histone H2B [Trichonephila clavata]|uniref:Histone H2B n=1 Tax=Trichonephila clavata TaxID=2740835 RepID=A0A8X6LDS5_TRICU|nr:histone H2B [Trichonephila clavata]
MNVYSQYFDREYRKRKKFQYASDISFKNYIQDVLKMVDEDASITAPAMKIIDALMKDMFNQLANGTKNLMEKDKKRTLDHLDVKCASLELLRGEVARHAIAEGTKAVESFINNVYADSAD